MTQIDLPLDYTLTNNVAHYLHAHVNEWVDGLTLSKIGGAYAWRSRVSDCRKKYHMVIENRMRRAGRVTISEYRLTIPSQIDT